MEKNRKVWRSGSRYNVVDRLCMWELDIHKRFQLSFPIPGRVPEYSQHKINYIRHPQIHYMYRNNGLVPERIYIGVMNYLPKVWNYLLCLSTTLLKFLIRNCCTDFEKIWYGLIYGKCVANLCLTALLLSALVSTQ